MLNQRIDILEAKPPLLFTTSSGAWHLVTDIKKIDEEKYYCTCIKQQNNTLQQYAQEIKETPFHVGNNIWELSYGSELMTLLDSSLNDHPATMLWKRWCKNN